MAEPLLRIEQLTTVFGKGADRFTAVNNCSFTLNKSEIIGVVGESGSGKSVTSLSVMGLIPPSAGGIESGNIWYHGRSEDPVDLAQLKESELRKYRGQDIAMIFQEPMTSLNPVYTCGAQVMEAIQIHRPMKAAAAKAEVIRLFEQVQLPRAEQLFKAYPHQLSGGQKQRVMIAMAMSCNPRILIADEPTTALDVTVQKHILQLIRSLQAQTQMGVIFITHDLGVIAELAHRVVVMYKGQIVEQGEVQQIFKNPQHPYTKGLLACRPPLQKRPVHLPTVSDFMEIGTDGQWHEKPLDVRFTAEISAQERAQKHQELYAREPMLSVRNLCTWYKVRKSWRTTETIKAVDEVSFEVYPGETLGLVGESGCGKTTLGRSILRLIPPTSGQVLFKGTDVASLTGKPLRQMRRSMQLIFQDPYSSLNPKMPVGEAILEPMLVHKLVSSRKEGEARVLSLLDRVSLPATAFHRYPHQFSGGQRQRICIARALGLSPEFIICDESVSALDVSVQAQVLNLLNELKHDFGFTYIFISHDLSVVKYMSDRMLVMNKGRMEALNDADMLYNEPPTEYTRQLIDAIPTIPF